MRLRPDGCARRIVHVPTTFYARESSADASSSPCVHRRRHCQFRHPPGPFPSPRSLRFIALRFGAQTELSSGSDSRRLEFVPHVTIAHRRVPRGGNISRVRYSNRVTMIVSRRSFSWGDVFVKRSIVRQPSLLVKVVSVARGRARRTASGNARAYGASFRTGRASASPFAATARCARAIARSRWGEAGSASSGTRAGRAFRARAPSPPAPSASCVQ